MEKPRYMNAMEFVEGGKPSRVIDEVFYELETNGVAEKTALRHAQDFSDLANKLL